MMFNTEAVEDENGHVDGKMTNEKIDSDNT